MNILLVNSLEIKQKTLNLNSYHKIEMFTLCDWFFFSNFIAKIKTYYRPGDFGPLYFILFVVVVFLS